MWFVCTGIFHQHLLHTENNFKTPKSQMLDVIFATSLLCVDSFVCQTHLCIWFIDGHKKESCDWLQWKLLWNLIKCLLLLYCCLSQMEWYCERSEEKLQYKEIFWMLIDLVTKLGVASIWDGNNANFDGGPVRVLLTAYCSLWVWF